MIAEVMQAVLDCAYEGLSTKPGLSSLVPGNEAAWDNCDCGGQLWVRLVSITPTYDRSKCIIHQTALLEVGIVRCVAVVNDDGVSPTAAEMTSDTVQEVTDAEELRDALWCCKPPKALNTVLGAWSPAGAQGGCAGGSWALSVVLPGCGCP